MTTKTKTKTPKVTSTVKDVSLPIHTAYHLTLEIKTTMTKVTGSPASFEYDMLINGVNYGFTRNEDAAKAHLYDLARTQIHEIQMMQQIEADEAAQRALVELEAANGVPEAVAELQVTPNYTIEYNRVTKDFDLLVVGGIEPLTSKGSYLEAETYARSFFNLDPLPF